MWNILITTLAATSLAAPLSVVHEKRNGFSSPGWQKADALDKDSVIPIKIGLTQQNLDKAYDHMMNAAHPSSKNYGKHWTLEEVQNEFAPSEESIQLVKGWLREEGISNVRQTSNRGWIAFDAPVSEVERLLNAKYSEFRGQDGSTRIGCDEYSIPEHLLPHIDYITPGVSLSPIVTRTKRSIGKPDASVDVVAAASENDSASLQNCAQSATPACLRAFYNLPAPINRLSELQLGVYESLDEYSEADLDKYYATYAPYVSKGTYPTLVSVDGGTAPAPRNGSNNGGESDIDLQTMYGMLGGVNITLYEVKEPFLEVGNGSEYDVTFFDPLLDAVDGSFCDAAEKENGFACGTANLTNVISVSYSIEEVFSYSLSSQQRVCNEFMKLSLQGHTFVFASGDSGVSGGFYGPCNASGCSSPTGGINGTILNTNFPANCPWVLAVGGTQLDPGQSVHDVPSAMNIPGLVSAETGCASIPVTYSSGGGFANYFKQPAYQKSAVSTYFANHDPGYPYYEYNGIDVRSNGSNYGANGGIYNRLGRGYPDVSANGRNFAAIHDGTQQLFNGTSLATPIWASIIAFLNEARAAHGKGPVGFVNAVLYENPHALIDVVKGNNPGCRTNGFSAVPGWDPITGLGAPNYTALHEVFLALP